MKSFLGSPPFWLILLLMFTACDDKGVIVSGLHDGERLQEGDPVPFEISQNYPNPFYPTTIVDYQIAIEMFITLAVYSEEWEEVLIVVEDVVEPGNHSSCIDMLGHPTGEYFYTLSGGGYTLIHKMRLVR